MKKYVFFGLLLAVTVFGSCEKKETDIEKPHIVLNKPAEGAVFEPGDVIHFSATLTDNVALASYKVNIHGAFDGHTHSMLQTGDMKTRANKDTPLESAVAFEQTWEEKDLIKRGESPIAGKQRVTLNYELTIPATINGSPVKEGHYHFILYCTDSSSQETFVAREIVIGHDHADHDHDHNHAH